MDIKISCQIEKLKETVQQAYLTGDKYQFQDPAYNIIDEIKMSEKPFEAVKPIFSLIENSPAIDFGGPGPLGSFLEGFYHEGYEEELVASLKRKPTEYTIALMFRIIADDKNPDSDEYKRLLKNFEKEPWLRQYWKDEIAKL